MTRYASPVPESGGQWTVASVLSVGAHAGLFLWILGLFPVWSPDRPDPLFRDTVVTIAPAVQQSAGTSVLTPQVAQPVDPVDTLAAETAPPAAFETLSAETSEVAAPVETLAPLAPESIPPEAQPVAPSTAPLSAPAPVAPILSTEAAQAALAEAAISPERAATAPLPTAPLAGTISEPNPPALPATGTDGQAETVVTALLPPTDLTARPPEPAPTPVPEGPAPSAAMTALIERIRARLDDPCLIALPRAQAPPLGPRVTTLTDQDVTASRFATAVLSGPDLPVELQSQLVDARQCPALVFLRGQPDYPAFALTLSLAQSQVASGGTMVGRIDGADGAYTSLLLVDDNGVVQDLRRFLRFTGGRAEFAIPVTRDGPPRETVHLLIALATSARPETITNLAGRLAADLFPPLTSELGNGARIAVQAIDIR